MKEIKQLYFNSEVKICLVKVNLKKIFIHSNLNNNKLNHWLIHPESITETIEGIIYRKELVKYLLNTLRDDDEKINN